MTTIVLKDLCREFNIDPHKLRQIFRVHRISKDKKGRYRWSEKSAELQKVRSLLSKVMSGPVAATEGSSAKSTPSKSPPTS